MDIDEQKSALDNLWYEILMLKETYDKLKSLAQLRGILFNIYIESFLVHARNLIYFLENKNDDRDIRCSDFGIRKQTVRLPQGNSLPEINKFLSHITWDRVKKEKPIWGSLIIKAIWEEIKNKKDIFIKQLPDNLFPTPRNGKIKNDFLEI